MNRIRTNLPVILASIKAKLVRDEAYNATTVFVADSVDDIDAPPSTSFCVIVPIGQETENPETDLVAGGIELHLFHRNTLDSRQRGDIQLIEPSGIMVKRLTVHRSLHLQELMIGPEAILAEPMRLQSFTQPTTENMIGKIVMAFSIKYGLDPFAEIPTTCRDTDDEFTCEFDFEFGEGGSAFSNSFSNAFA